MRIAVAVAVAVAALAVCAAADSLGPYNVDPTRVSVGGLSAGAFFAVQYDLAFSSEMCGAAVFAGGPWNCAQGSEETAITTCMNPLISKPNPLHLAEQATTAAAEGKLDPLSELANHNVYIYSGELDTVVHRPVVQALETFYKYFVNGTGQVETEYSILSEHCYPTLAEGNACARLGSPYIGKCNYDGAGAGLKAIYGSLKTKGTAVAANLMTWDQTKFATGHSLGTTGYIYVPTACQKNATCGLHAVFHGCEQTIADVGTKFVTEIGLNDWAESNNIIMLYPQVKRSDIIPSNPEGCFDWWGYTGQNYATKTGAQMAFVHDVMSAVQGSSA